jgi:hypothetical protein
MHNRAEVKENEHPRVGAVSISWHRTIQSASRARLPWTSGKQAK